jgi:hypothetical protein
MTPMPFDAGRDPDTITTVVSVPAVLDALIDLRLSTLWALARCRDLLDRMEPRSEPAEVRDAAR